MTLTSYIFGIATAVGILVLVVELLRRGKLRERHAIWWLIVGIFSLVVAVFPSVLEGLASALGIEIPINLVFFVGIATLFVVSLQHSSEIATLEEKTRKLAEEIAILKVSSKKQKS